MPFGFEFRVFLDVEPIPKYFSDSLLDWSSSASNQIWFESMTDKPDVTGLAVLSFEADALVHSFRMKYHAVAADGVPAHITILFPFMHPDAVDGAVIAQLRRLFAGHDQFDYALTDIRRFPNVIYLASEPAQPFISLTKAVVTAFSDYPPFEGQFPDIIPHLTVAYLEDQPALNKIEMEFAARAATSLPLQVNTKQVWLLERRDGRWRKHTAFALS